MVSVDTNTKIAIIGLGYVGLPLAVAFGKKYQTIGFDINQARIEELKSGVDHTLEVSKEELASVTSLTFSCEPADIGGCDYIIVTVPTPIDKNKQPDLTPLRKASEMIGKVITAGTTVVYECPNGPGLSRGHLQVCPSARPSRSGWPAGRRSGAGCRDRTHPQAPASATRY